MNRGVLGMWQNGTDLRQGRYSGEQAEQNGLCQRSISNPVSNKSPACLHSTGLDMLEERVVQVSKMFLCI